MYISRRQSRIIAVGTLILFFLIGAWFTQKPTPAPSSTPSSVSSSQPTASTQTSTSLTTTSSSTQEKQPLVAQPEPPAAAQPKTEEENQKAPASQFALEEFRRSETKDGKLIWEIFGTNARYIPEENSVAIDNCKLMYYTEDNKQIDLTSGTALIFLSGVKLERAELRDNVVLVYNGDITVKTTEADFDKAKDLVTSDKFVTISGDWYSFEGTGLHADLETETVTLETDVHSQIHPERRA